jgi:hypothetical protein
MKTNYNIVSFEIQLDSAESKNSAEFKHVAIAYLSITARVGEKWVALFYGDSNSLDHDSAKVPNCIDFTYGIKCIYDIEGNSYENPLPDPIKREVELLVNEFCQTITDKAEKL